jgi:acyl-CoA synthetase (AMP-forming)/AMP-acid ligase II
LSRLSQPVARPQFGLEHLPRGVPRQGVDDLQGLRVLVARQPFSEEFVEFVQAQTILGDDRNRDRHLAPLIVLTTDDRDLNDGGVEATAEAFAGGWFHSGDLVRMDEEGYVWVVDRKKDMIISGGENIYCAELENVLAGHPGIVEVAVIGRPHDKWGEVPIAVAALAQSDLRLEDLDEFLTERLARYKHPKGLEIVDALPRNPAGKVLKTELRTRYGVHKAPQSARDSADPITDG